MTFPRRGIYRQEAFRILTRFPFDSAEVRHVNLKTEALVYPSVGPSEEYLEVFAGIQGALESLAKGRGQDLYALRDYVPTDSARHVHWKASARFGSLMVREFAREDDCRICLSSTRIYPRSSAGFNGNLRDKRALRACCIHLCQLACISTKTIPCCNSAAPPWKPLSLPQATSSSPCCATSRSSSLCRPTPSNTHGRARRLARPFQNHCDQPAPRLHPRLGLSSSYVVFLDDPEQ